MNDNKKNWKGKERKGKERKIEEKGAGLRATDINARLPVNK